MILYVESNFILELAFLQHEAHTCEQILNLARNSALTLVLPAFCISEPYEVLIRRKKQRQELYRRIQDGTHELARSSPYQETATAIQQLMEVFRSSTEEDQQRLEEAIQSVLNAATIIPTEAETIRQALANQHRYDLGPQDAIIYTSILQHLRAAPTTPKCFITKNANDFDSPDIRAELNFHDCHLLTTFANGLGYLNSQTKTQ